MQCLISEIELIKIRKKVDTYAIQPPSFFLQDFGKFKNRYTEKF